MLIPYFNICDTLILVMHYVIVDDNVSNISLFLNRCIPEESNEIPGKSNDKRDAEQSSQGKPIILGLNIGYWVEILIIGGLVLVCICLALLCFSLARYNYRLKQRLRSSAEVLVPQSGVTIIPALS